MPGLLTTTFGGAKPDGLRAWIGCTGDGNGAIAGVTSLVARF